MTKPKIEDPRDKIPTGGLYDEDRELTSRDTLHRTRTASKGKGWKYFHNNNAPVLLLLRSTEKGRQDGLSNVIMNGAVFFSFLLLQLCNSTCYHEEIYEMI